MIIEAYRGINYDPIHVDVPTPDIKWNPQRPDPQTPFWKLAGYQQCMGNGFQNLANWLGEMDSNLVGFAKMDTFSYYHGYEIWLKQNNKKPGDWQIYGSQFHCDYLNVILQNAGSRYRLHRLGDTHIDDVAEYHEKFRRPALLGMSWTKSGHIITSKDTIRKKDELYGLVCSDPYGLKPYIQRYGHNIIYEKHEFINNISSFIRIDMI